MYTAFTDLTHLDKKCGNFFRKYGGVTRDKIMELISYEFLKVC